MSSPKPPDLTDLALTVEELSVLLRVNPKTLYDAVKEGSLPGAVRLGRVIRIHGPTVQKWLEAGSGPKPRKPIRRR